MLGVGSEAWASWALVTRINIMNVSTGRRGTPTRAQARYTHCNALASRPQSLVQLDDALQRLQLPRRPRRVTATTTGAATIERRGDSGVPKVHAGGARVHLHRAAVPHRWHRRRVATRHLPCQHLLHANAGVVHQVVRHLLGAQVLLHRLHLAPESGVGEVRAAQGVQWPGGEAHEQTARVRARPVTHTRRHSHTSYTLPSSHPAHTPRSRASFWRPSAPRCGLRSHANPVLRRCPSLAPLLARPAAVLRLAPCPTTRPAPPPPPQHTRRPHHARAGARCGCGVVSAVLPSQAQAGRQPAHARMHAPSLARAALRAVAARCAARAAPPPAWTAGRSRAAACPWRLRPRHNTEQGAG